MSLKEIAIPGRIQKILEQQRQSDLTVASFCRKKKIPLSTFYNWRRQFKGMVSSTQAPTPAEFIAVKIRNTSEPSPISEDRITISFPSGMSMTVPCTPTLVRELTGVALKSEGVI